MGENSRGQYAFNSRGSRGANRGFMPETDGGAATAEDFSLTPAPNPGSSCNNVRDDGAAGSSEGHGGGSTVGHGGGSYSFGSRGGASSGPSSFGHRGGSFASRGGGATAEDFSAPVGSGIRGGGASSSFGGRGGSAVDAGQTSTSSFGIRGRGSSFGRGASSAEVPSNMSSAEPSFPRSDGSASGRGGRGSSFGRGGISQDTSGSAVPPSSGFSGQPTVRGAGNSFGRGDRAPRGGGESIPPVRFGAPPAGGNQPGGNIPEKKQDDGVPRPPVSNYVPEVRAVDDLFKEDVDHAFNYLSIAEGDEEVTVSGPNIGHIRVIDFWKDAGFEQKLLFNIVERAKYTRPRKIQAQVIPFIMEGRDVKGHAETGSGKTAAFMLPIINAIMKTDRVTSSAFDPPSPYAIIVEPTRELCGQVCEQGRKFAFDTGVYVAKAYGEYNMRENMKELQLGCDILCATPGRLKHLMTSNLILLNKFRYFVLDEADHLLEDQFLNDIRDMFNVPNFPPKEKRQTMLFSATFPELVQKLSAEVLREEHVMVSNKKLISTNSKVKQSILSVLKEDKKTELLEILKREQEEASKNNVVRRTLVFVRTKRDTDLVSLYLTESGVKATTLHGDRSQGLREKALRDFRNAETPVLVTTDVCARGIDVKDLEHVINFDLPGDAVTYVHRIGRTGRIKQGMSTSFFDEFDSNDCNIAKDLVQFLEDVNQAVPEFLKKVVSGGGFSAAAPLEVQAPAASAVDDGW